MSETHWKKTFNPNYLGGWDFEPGKDKILTIKTVKVEECTFEGGRKEMHNVAYWKENEKPMICNVTNCKTIAKLLDTPFIERWAGHKIQLWFDPSVKGKSGEVTGGVRVRTKLPKQADIPCEECGQFIQPAYSMSGEELAAYTRKKFGKALCADCAKEKKEAKTDAAE